MNTVPNIFEVVVEEMSSTQRQAALELLLKIVQTELTYTTEQSGVYACPHCGCPHIVKCGLSRGTQRYQCKECSRIFSQKTNKILGLTKLDRSVWVAYVPCMFDGLSLRDCAASVGVSLRTSFFMRHRILECMKKHLDSFYVGSGQSAQIDEYHVRESFTGNHKHNARFQMPRKSKKRSSDGLVSGISNNLICVLSGINEHGDCFLELACRGRLTKQRSTEILSGKLLPGSIVSSDKHPSYKTVVPALGVATHNRYDSKNRSKGTINAINALHARLAKFLGHFGSIATRRLENYLTWFMWIESFKKVDHIQDRKNLMTKHMVSGAYKTKFKDYRDTPYPFSDYYGEAGVYPVL